MRAAGRPLEGSYGTTLAIVVLALAPNIVVSTAYFLFQPQLVHDLGAGRTGLEVAQGFSNAGYAFGALVGGYLIQLFPQRRLFFLAEGAFVVGCILSAASGGVALYGTGRVIQGTATGLLLVIAVPPLVQRFPPARMPSTAATLNIGFFGAVTLGPIVGGIVAAGHDWRWLYAVLAVCGAFGLALASMTLESPDPPNPDLPFDRSAIGLALVATFLPFYAASVLTGASFISVRFLAPLLVGLVCFAALLVTQYVKDEPLAPVKPMTTTLPLIGLLAAMVGGGAFVAFLLLGQQFLLKVEKHSPLSTGLAFWPQVAGVAVGALALALLLRSRHMASLTLAGMLCLIAGGALLIDLHAGGSRTLLLGAAAALGLGAGASVAPGLWLAGFSLPAEIIGRTFALVELVRSEADFILAPVLLKIAVDGGSPAAGIHRALWITLIFAAAGTALGVAVYVAGGVRAERPDLEGWLEEGELAVESPPLGAALRPAR